MVSQALLQDLSDRSWKRINKLKWLDNFKLDKLVGFAGVLPQKYVENLRKNGIKDIILYENDPFFYKNSSEKLKGYENVYLVKGDILDSTYKKDYIYDLCYFGYINSVEHIIRGFQDNFVLTFNISNTPIEQVWKTFFEWLGEEEVGYEYESRGEKEGLYSSSFITTNKGNRFVFVSYRDIITPLITIYKEKL